MTGAEIVMGLLIGINGIVILIEMISWTRYLKGLERKKEVDEYLQSQQFQKDKEERLEETYKMIDRLREQKDKELLCKVHKDKKSKPTPKGRNMIDNL